MGHSGCERKRTHSETAPFHVIVKHRQTQLMSQDDVDGGDREPMLLSSYSLLSLLANCVQQQEQFTWKII